ncbi:hypothetical protein O181_036131 [Austropuccinia psidii MF-1]|uniref:Retrotransposon gag domain-containing protein n=1 Tax=Austropuccinia psidii MF-1 TaxID=1389203 RepID=A0A9Q3D9L8_9BASI|nr:hypothetical protein [Austropuccinia psidii MF-1]
MVFWLSCLCSDFESQADTYGKGSSCHTASVHQLSANLDREPPMEGEAPSRRGGMKTGSRLGEAEDEEAEYEQAEVETALADFHGALEATNIAHYNQPLVSQAEANFIKMMKKMTRLMGQITQAVTPRDNSKALSFKPPSMKAPDSFDGTQAHKLIGFIQSCKLIFHDEPENFFLERKKFPYSTFFLDGRAGKWIEPYLSNILNEDPSYLLNNWKLFETQLFTLVGDPNEFRKSEQELDKLRMKESGQASLYIAYVRSLMSRIGDWGEREYIHVYRRGLE